MFKHPHCGGQHSTVAEARACQGMGTTLVRTVAQDTEQASDNAKSYLADLLNSRDYAKLSLHSQGRIVAFKLNGRIHWRACRELIDALKACPFATLAPTPPSAPQVPTGYYAIQMESQDKPHFYRVKQGRSRLFLDEQVSDFFYPVHNRTLKNTVLREIAKDPAAAGLAYATEMGCCYRCHRTLTDHNNPFFHLGLGPDCGKK